MIDFSLQWNVPSSGHFTEWLKTLGKKQNKQQKQRQQKRKTKKCSAAQENKIFATLWSMVKIENIGFWLVIYCILFVLSLLFSSVCCSLVLAKSFTCCAAAIPTSKSFRFCVQFGKVWKWEIPNLPFATRSFVVCIRMACGCETYLHPPTGSI